MRRDSGGTHALEVFHILDDEAHLLVRLQCLDAAPPAHERNDALDECDGAGTRRGAGRRRAERRRAEMRRVKWRMGRAEMGLAEMRRAVMGHAERRHTERRTTGRIRGRC